MFKQKRCSGFTLIELMIVICILGILIAVARGVMGGNKLQFNSSSDAVTHRSGPDTSAEYKCVNGFLVERSRSNEKEVQDKFGRQVSCKPE